MKIAIIIVRTLVGLMFLFASITYFLNIAPPPEFSGNTKAFFDGIASSGYILPIAKVIEFLCGAAFVSGRFIALAVVLIFPIIINILMINILHTPSGLPIVVPLFLGILFLGFVNFEKYLPLFEAK